MEHFPRKRDATPVRMPYKTCQKHMVPTNIFFVEIIELRRQKYFIKPVENTWFRKSQNVEHFSSQARYHAGQNAL